MGRLQELAQSIKGLETMGQFAKEDDTSFHVFHVESTILACELAHEKVLQLTRIANVLEAAMPEGAILVGHLERRLTEVENNLAGLGEVVGSEVENINSRVDMLDGQLEALYEKATQHIADDVTTLDTQETEAYDPYADPFLP